MMFNPGAVAWTRDISTAYYCSLLGGCEGGLQPPINPLTGESNPKRMKIPGERRNCIGCTPETCKGTCTKSLFCIRWRDSILRYAAPVFRSKYGGQVLETLLAPLLRKIRAKGILVICWVDDVCCIIPNTDNPSHNLRTYGGEHVCCTARQHSLWQRNAKRNWMRNWPRSDY